MLRLGVWSTHSRIMLRIWYSMSSGWSPTATLVRPGRSTSVRLRTWGE